MPGPSRNAAKLAIGELDAPPCARDDARDGIDDEVAEHVVAGHFGLAPAPAEHLHARDQFFDRERLTQVIVAAGSEPANAFVGITKRAEDQHGRVVLHRSQRLEHLEPIDLRQHAVEHDDIVGFGRGLHQPGPSIGGDIYEMTLLEERPGHMARDAFVVFDQENVHAPSCQPGAPR